MERLVAKKENMEFYFHLVSANSHLIEVDMYSTPYTLDKKQDMWQNSSKNRFNMSPGLIEAVKAAISEYNGLQL